MRYFPYFKIFIITVALLIFYKSPINACGKSDQLLSAITMAQEALILEQEEEGYWFSHVETNTFYNSLQILLYYYLEKEEEEKQNIEGLCYYLLSKQSEDGSWPLYDGGPPDLGLTTLNYFTLLLTGYHKFAPNMILARSYIRDHGGAESIHFFYQAILTLFDQFLISDSIPQLSILPLIYLSPQLSWFRIMTIPLTLIINEEAFYKPPMHAYIADLFHYTDKTSMTSENRELTSVIGTIAAEAQKTILAEESSFSAVLWNPYEIYVDWLLARQNTTDGLFYDYMPNTFFSLLSLKVLEDIVNSEEAINRGLQGLRSMQQLLPEGIYQAPSDSTIMDTDFAVWGLFQTGVSIENPCVQKGVDFLWAHQNNKYGDWIYQVAKKVSPGGWGFSLNSESYPDVDDTAMTLFVLKDIYSDRWYEREEDFKRGIDWLLAMQNWDGGWGTWDRQPGLLSIILNIAMKTVAGPVVLNESVVDHTTRVLMALGSFGYTEANSQQVLWAVRWVKGQRLADGSWAGTWAVDYVYQTAMVLGGLSLVKATMNNDFIQRSLNYILEKQNKDGGWGESPLSFSAGHYVPLGYSSPSQTAMILFGLFQFLKGRDYQYSCQLKAPIEKAINFILDSQAGNGLWNDQTFAAVVFPQIQYARYPIWQESIILTALGLYSQNRKRFQASPGENPEICDGLGLDEDCDGRIDCNDPDCGHDLSCQAYTGTANAEAAAYGDDSLRGSGIFNELTLFLVPISVLICMRTLWKRRGA